jgi:ABC-2 type transport system permease protein
MKHLKSKAFIISTIITMFLIFVMTNLGSFFSKEQQEDVKKIGIVTSSSRIETYVKDEIKEEKKKISITSFSTEKEAKKEIKNNHIQAYLVLKQDKKSFITGTYKANEMSEQSLLFELEHILQVVKQKEAIYQLNMDSEKINQINEPFTLKKETLLKTSHSDKEIKQSLVIVMGTLFLIYATVVFYGNMIATEVASEKSSRVMEVLVSSVPAAQQMFGKIFGLALLGITQYGFFFLSGSYSAVRNLDKLKEVPTSTFVYAVVFFALGYFLYAMILATFGSLVSRIEDVYQIISPINIVLIIGFALSIAAFVSPTSKAIMILSYIPFFAPMLMFLRVSLVAIPFWQIALCIGILLLSIVFFAYLGAKVYRGGVLIYGKASFANIVKALRLFKKDAK